MIETIFSPDEQESLEEIISFNTFEGEPIDVRVLAAETIRQIRFLIRRAIRQFETVTGLVVGIDGVIGKTETNSSPTA